MDTTKGMEKVHNVPVPERYLPLVYAVLADAHRAEAAARSGGTDTPNNPPNDGDPMWWTEDEVIRAYRESSPKQRAAFDYLADNSNEDVKSRDLALAVYPDHDPDEAEGKLYGVLGSFGRRSASKYGKKKWFFHSYRDRFDNGAPGYFLYKMRPEVASWVKKASGRE